MARNFIYDVNTTNISFVQTAVDLKKLGIKNNMFFLKLYDPSLRGIDPHSPFLTNDQIVRIINECIINPWYYLREVARIPDQGNPKGVPYLLNRANLAATWCFINGIDNYLVIPRQIGKTESTIANITWAFLFGSTNAEMMFLNITAERAIANLSKVKDQRALLPPYLQFKIAFDDEGKEIKGVDNTKTLKNASNGNSIVTKPSARGIESAERIGRGSSQVIQYYDEFEFISYIKTIMAASGPAYSTASENAKRNNSIHCRILTSTPGDLDSQAGMDALEIIENTCKFSETFYDKPIEDVYEYIETNSINRIVYIEFQYQQLGKDESWFNKVCAYLNGDKLKIQREIFLRRMHGSSQSPYDAEDLDAIQDRKGTIKEEIYINKIFKLDVYEPLNKNRIYFIGVDVSNGYGQDNSAVTVWDPYTLKTVAEFKSPYIGVKGLIKFLYILVMKYLPKSILAIERNANGEAVLDHLRDSEIRGNLYYDNNKELLNSVDDKLDGQGFIRQEAARRRLYGIWTGGKSREVMFSLLDDYVKEHKDSFVGANIIDDLMKLVRVHSKIQAITGQHDDSIMSFLMCLYLYYYGNNLARYGFTRGGLPEEEEQNKGMDYGEIVNALSETDRAFFGIAEQSEINMGIDISSMIQEKRGLLSRYDLHNEIAPGEMKKKYTPKMDPYSMKLYNEMMQAQRESEDFNNRVGFNNGYKNIDELAENDYSFSLDLFDELNN